MIKKWYRENLQKFVNFVGEPSGTKVRDYLLMVMAIVYIVSGTIIVKFPENIFLKIMGFTSSRWVALVSGTMYIGGIFMLIMWIFLFNKICWINKKRIVTAEKCWLVLRILFVFVLPLIYIKKCISFVLRETRQQTVATYIPEIFLALFLTFITFSLIEMPILKWISQMCEKVFIIILTEEFIALCMVVILISTFFASCRWIVHLSIKLNIKELKRKELKRISKVNVRGTMKSADIRKELEKKYVDLREKADIELKYTELYFYVCMNVILLSLHMEESDIYEKMFANAFVGVTTLAALFREVNSNKENEKRIL